MFLADLSEQIKISSFFIYTAQYYPYGSKNTLVCPYIVYGLKVAATK